MPPLIRRKAGRKPAAPDDWRVMGRGGADQLRSAEALLRKGQWHASTLASFQAFRLIAEGLVAFRVGIRTATEGAGELAYLLLRHFPGVEGLVERFIRLSDLHQEVRFESRAFSEAEAQQSLSGTQEFSRWASTQLPLTT